jgi:hypothetical protein
VLSGLCRETGNRMPANIFLGFFCPHASSAHPVPSCLESCCCSLNATNMTLNTKRCWTELELERPDTAQLYLPFPWHLRSWLPPLCGYANTALPEGIYDIEAMYRITDMARGIEIKEHVTHATLLLARQHGECSDAAAIFRLASVCLQVNVCACACVPVRVCLLRGRQPLSINGTCCDQDRPCANRQPRVHSWLSTPLLTSSSGFKPTPLSTPARPSYCSCLLLLSPTGSHALCTYRRFFL